MCHAQRMWPTSESEAEERTAMKHQILAFLDEYCRGMTLQDVREWYADAFASDEIAPIFAPGVTP